MSDYNQKVDLRPQWAISDTDEPSGKPHVDAVLHPEQRLTGIPRGITRLSPSQLTGVQLRKTGARSSIDAEGLRTVNHSPDHTERKPNVKQPHVDVFAYRVLNSNESDVTMPSKLPPPAPPMPYRQMSQPKPILKRDNSTSPVVHETTEQLARNEIELIALRAEMARLRSQLEGNSQKREPPPYVANPSPIKVKMMSNRPSQDGNFVQPTPRYIKDRDVHKRFDDNPNHMPEGMERWVDELVQDKFERLSRLDTYEKQQAKDVTLPRYPKGSKSRERQSRRKSHDTIPEVPKPRSESCCSKPESIGSVRSAARSIKSVLFKKTEEEELHSEITDDDIADINAGETGFVDFTSSKFTIHGPFVDKELNVFHAVCAEYQLAAGMSFAKRSAFSRTNPAHERVYALLGSNRRSSWTNRDSWSKATNDLRVLDFLFRKTIRSESKRIREPVMELEHFREGATLDGRRFWKIMNSIFRKREHLAAVLGVNVDKFEDIK
jgi:hypothetical protein